MIETQTVATKVYEYEAAFKAGLRKGYFLSLVCSSNGVQY